MPLRDRLDRPLRSLRLSVTDRCNLRCGYCMPEDRYPWLPRADLLSFEEIARLVDAFLALGVRKLRLTGGEPLLRRDLSMLIGLLACKPDLVTLALTTNGLLLAEQARDLRRAGLQRLTVSLDTLDRARFRALTRRDDLDAVLAGLEAALRAGFDELKLDTVVVRDTNEDEIPALLEHARSIGAELRFIEYMDVGGATRWHPERVVPRSEILARVAEHYGPPEPLPGRGSAPAERFRLPSGQTFGVIASTSAPFCAACDRARLTADGHLFLCLYARAGLDLRTPLRAGADAGALERLVRGRWRDREARGAEERLAQRERRPLAPAAHLRENPHLEMHTRGG